MSEVARRLKARLEDPQFRNRYKGLLDDPRMRELAEVMRDFFCRPMRTSGEMDGNAALYAQGYSAGAWDFYEGLFSFLDVPVEEPVIEETYQEGKNETKREGKASENESEN